MHGKGAKSHNKITGTPEAEEAFEALKFALQTPATPRLPDASRPFTQVADETDGCVTPAAYCSAKVDSFAAGFPRGLRAIAAAEKAAKASRGTVGHSRPTLLAPHDVSMQEQNRFHIPRACRLRCNTDFEDMRCSILDPATLLPPLLKNTTAQMFFSSFSLPDPT